MKLGKYLDLIKSKTIDGIIRADIDISHEDIKELPDFLSGSTVTGYFAFNDNPIDSLKNCPNIVEDDFDCSHTNIKNLIGSPKRVEGLFDCCGCNLTSLEGLPEHIGKVFYINKAVWDKLPKDTNEAIYLLLNNKVRFYYNT